MLAKSVFGRTGGPVFGRPAHRSNTGGRYLSVGLSKGLLAIAAGDLGQAKHVAGLLQVAFAQAEVSGEEASDSTLEGKAGSGRVLLRGIELGRQLLVRRVPDVRVSVA